jgi:prepilin-type N-terminal cleavage/methylation domain-containing protein
MSRRTRTRAQRSSPAGFTLVELVVVMTIAGVLAASIGPKFFSQQIFSERGYADELGAALRLTQKAAVISNCPARLTLTAGTYAAAQQAAAGNTCLASDATWSTPVLGIDGSILQGSAPANTAASPVGVYQFDAQGRLTSSPGTTVTIGARTITIDAGTGFVQVQ